MGPPSEPVPLGIGAGGQGDREGVRELGGGLPGDGHNNSAQLTKVRWCIGGKSCCGHTCICDNRYCQLFSSTSGWLLEDATRYARWPGRVPNRQTDPGTHILQYNTSESDGRFPSSKIGVRIMIVFEVG